MKESSQQKQSCQQGEDYQMDAPHENIRNPYFKGTQASLVLGIDDLRKFKKRLAALAVEKVTSNRSHTTCRAMSAPSHGFSQKNFDESSSQVFLFVVNQNCKSVINDFKASFSNKVKFVELDDGIEAIVPEVIDRKIEENTSNQIPLKNRLEFKKNNKIFEQDKQNRKRYNCEESWSVDVYDIKTPHKEEASNASAFDYGDSVVDSSMTLEKKDDFDENDVSQLDQAFVDSENLLDPKGSDTLVQQKNSIKNKAISQIEFNPPVLGDLTSQKNEEGAENAEHCLKNNGQKLQQKLTLDEPAQSQLVEDPINRRVPDAKIQRTQWFKQLLTISYAQTELTYMCQHLDWTIKFAQIGVENFCGRAEVSIIKDNNFIRYVGTCKAEKSKRQARHSSAVACLAQLYLNIDGLWQKYKTIKEENPSLCQPMKSQNAQVLKDWLQERVTVPEKVIKIEDEDKHSQSEVDKYVESLNKGCKKELYYFLAQNNKRFMAPKWISKKSSMFKWLVVGYVRYQIKEKIYEFRQKDEGKNRKEGEENVSHRLLKEIYKGFPSLYKQFRKLKEIKTFV